jgi:hypothetical protein
LTPPTLNEPADAIFVISGTIVSMQDPDYHEVVIVGGGKKQLSTSYTVLLEIDTELFGDRRFWDRCCHNICEN